MRSWVDGHSTRVGIELDGIEIPAILVRFAPVEDRSFELPLSRINTCCHNAEAHVCCILPMVRERRSWVVHRRRTMHKSDWTKRWLSRWCCINAPRQPLVDLALVKRTQLHPEVMRVLTIV